VWKNKGGEYSHEKTLLGFSPASEPRRASNLVPRLAYYRKITLAGRSLQKNSPQSKINLRADKISTVPFVSGLFSDGKES
jgi:hypothetical protein